MTHTIRVVAGAVLDGTNVLCALRGPTMSTPNKWELPGGKVEPGESDAAALVRELMEELGIGVEVGEHLGTSRHGAIELVAYVVHPISGTPSPTEHAELRWVAIEDLEGLEWATADIPLLQVLRDRVSSEGNS